MPLTAIRSKCNLGWRGTHDTSTFGSRCCILPVYRLSYVMHGADPASYNPTLLNCRSSGSLINMGCGSSQAQELPQGSLIQSEEAEASQGSLHQPEETVERHEPREIPSEDSRLGRNNFFCSEEDSNQNQSANGDGDLESTGNPSMTKISNEEEVNSSKGMQYRANDHDL